MITLRRKRFFFPGNSVTENVYRVLSRKEVNEFSTRLDINWTLNRRDPVGSDEYIFSASFGRKWHPLTLSGPKLCSWVDLVRVLILDSQTRRKWISGSYLISQRQKGSKKVSIYVHDQLTCPLRHYYSWNKHAVCIIRRGDILNN